jgi:hypothetical protein
VGATARNFTMPTTLVTVSDHFVAFSWYQRLLLKDSPLVDETTGKGTKNLKGNHSLKVREVRVVAGAGAFFMNKLYLN